MMFRGEKVKKIMVILRKVISVEYFVEIVIGATSAGSVKRQIEEELVLFGDRSLVSPILPAPLSADFRGIVARITQNGHVKKETAEGNSDGK